PELTPSRARPISRVVHRTRHPMRLGLAAALAVLLASCGGGDICLNCTPGGPTPSTLVSITGNISQLSILVPFDQVSVIICLDLPPDKGASDCTHFFLAPVSETGAFARSSIQPGSETIFFWIDQNGNGMVNPGDPIARLQDPDGELVDVSTGQTVNV